MRQAAWLTATLLMLAPSGLRAADPSQQTHWDLGSFSYVKLVPAEAGAAPNAQPAKVSAEALQALLGPVRATIEGKAVALFHPDELKKLAPALSEALALAQPDQDVVLVSTSRRGHYFQRAEAITARCFVQDGALNLLVHDARLAFMDAWVDEDVLPTFVYGSRTAAAGAQLRAPEARSLRPDWLALPLELAASAPVSPAAAPAAPAAPSPVPPPVPPVVPPPAPATPQAVAEPAVPATKPAAPAPEATPATPTPEEAAYQAKAERLRTLKRLRDDNLISEAEYQAKREAILKAL